MKILHFIMSKSQHRKLLYNRAVGQMLTKADEGGGGVSQMLTIADEPPILADVICEQLLKWEEDYLRGVRGFAPISKFAKNEFQ